MDDFLNSLPDNNKNFLDTLEPAQQKPAPSTWENIKNDIKTNIIDPYLNGAQQAWDESLRAENQRVQHIQETYDSLGDNGMSEGEKAQYTIQNNPYTADDQAYEKSAGKQLWKGTVQPVIMGASMVPGPQQAVLAPAAGADWLGDVAEKAHSDGIGAAVRDNTYGPIVDWASQDDLGKNIIERPVSTIGQGALSALPAAIGGRLVYHGVKAGVGRVGEYDSGLNALDESIPKAPQATGDSFLDALPDARGSKTPTPSNGSVPLGDNAFSYAVEKSGTPYELGGDGVSSTDCGKLVQDSFNAAGVDWNNRYVPSMIAEAQEKGAWHPAGDGYVPQKGDAAVVLGDNHVILADGEGGYVGANSSTGVIKKPSIADDFGDVTGYISVDDMTGGRRAQAKATPQSDPYRTGESDFQPGDDFKAADIPDDNADIFGRPTEQVADEFPAAAMAKEAVLPPKESFMDMPMEKATPQDFENHIYSKIEELPLEQRPIDISPEIKQPKMLTPEEDALKIFNDEAQKAGFPTDKTAEFPTAREFSKAPDYQKIVQDEFADPVDKILGNTPEYARGINEEMMNKAYEAVSNNDYKAAAELARRAGANDWAKQFDLLDKTAGGNKPVEPRLNSTPAGEYAGDTITKRQIVKRAADLFVPIRTGRIGKADVMGFADHNAGVIRTRDYGNLDTMAHEIGHITDAALGLRGDAGAFDREFIRVVDNRFGKDAYEPAQKRAEGIAEFMKDYLTNENKAKTEMPEYYSQFKAALEKNPDIKGRVNEVKSMVETWQKQSPEARGRGAVSYADEMKPTVKERAKQAKLKFVEDWVDDKVGLKRVTESYERATGERLATKDDPYKMARLAQNSSVARAQMLVEGDKPELVKAALNKVYGNIIDKGITIKGVLKELDASPELKGRQDYLKEGGFKNWHEALDSLLVARRQAELQTIYADYKGPMSRADAQAIIERAPKALNDAAQKIYAYNDNILRILKENGMIKPEVYEALTDKYHNYVPMARDFADESGLEKGFGMGGQGFGNVRAALKAISEEGSTRQVVSPLESIVKNTYAMLNLVERNRVGQTFVKMAEGDRVGKLVEEVTGAANTKDSTFSVWVNGEKKVYQTEPEIYRAIMSVNKDTANIITKLLSPPAQLLRAGATLTPDFAIKNIMRDSFGAAVFSRYGFRPIIDHAAGLFHMAQQDALFHEYKASGALMSTMVGLDRDYVQGSLKGLYKKDVAHYWNHYNPVQILRGFSEMLETATRLGEYSRAVGKGVSVEDAALSARDISLDFSKHGVYGKTANKIIAFFNAGVQEPARIIQAFKENPVGTSAKIAMYITIPSVALWAMNHNESWYKELPAYQKNLFWCIGKFGWYNDPVYKDRILRIPKPFGLGVLFGSMPERMLDYMETRKPQEMKEWAKSAFGAFAPNFMPTAVGPIIEWATGYSFFQGRDIVPQKEQKLPDELQYGPNTSELAKEIGRIFGVSPRKLDNTISGYGAGLANQTLNIADSLAGKREYQNPFQKAFTVDPMKSPQSVQDFYDKLNEVQKMYNGAKATKTKLDKDNLHNYNLLNYANQNMEYLNKMERIATQKGDDARVAEIKRKQLDVAQKAMKVVR